MQHDEKKYEQKQQLPPYSIMPLTREAFERPPDSGSLEGKTALLNELYKKAKPDYEFLVIKKDKEGKTVVDDKKNPVYEPNEIYKQQFRSLCDRFADIATKLGIEVEYVSSITAFPNHLFALPLSKNDFSVIKSDLEDYVALLTRKINVDKEFIKKKFLEKKIEFKEEDLDKQVEIAKKQAAAYELLKKGTINIIGPSLAVCGVGTRGIIAICKAMLMGGTTLQDAWCDLRSNFVNKFIDRHKDIHEISDNIKTHIDVVLLTHAFRRGWGLRTEINVDDPYKHLTAITPIVESFLDNDVLNYYDLRLMAETFATHFQKTFWENYRLAETFVKPNTIFTDWFPVHPEVAACADDFLKQWKIDIAAIDLFEKKYEPDKPKREVKESEEKQPNLYRLRPLYAKQIFLRYCQSSEHFVNPSEWIEEKGVFEDFRLMRARSPAYADLAWIEKVTEGEIPGFGKQVVVDVVSFDDLPEKEKTNFYIYATIHFGRPDPFRWLAPSPKFSDVVREEKDIIAFAVALAKQNQFERHELLLRSLMKEAPHRLATILKVVNEEEVGKDNDRIGNNVQRILDTINISFEWTHAVDYPWVKLKKEEDFYEELKEDTILDEPLKRALADRNCLHLAAMLNQKLHADRERLAAFHSKYVSKEVKFDAHALPIPYSILLNNADNATEADQFVYQLYFRWHHPVTYRRLSKEKNLNYAKEFKATYKKFIVDNNFTILKQQIYLSLKDGNIEEIKALGVSIKDTLSKLVVGNASNFSSSTLKYLYDLAVKEYSDDKRIFGMSLLHWAAVFNQVDVITALLAVKENVNEVNQDGSTALHYAATLGHIDAVKLLLQAGAKSNLINKSGESAFATAAYNDHLEIVQIMLEQSADIVSTDQSLNPALSLAISSNNINMVRLLLQYYARINVFRDFTKPLLSAVELGNRNILRLLIEYGADVNIKSADGKTPLHCAAIEGKADIVKDLLAAGADPTSALYQGKTPAAVAKTPYIRQLLQAAELKNKKTQLEKKPFAENYYIVQPKPPVFQDGIWQGWLEDQHGKIVSFDELEPRIKMLYHIHCTVNHVFPDRFGLAQPPVTLTSPYTEEKSLQTLAHAIADDNQFEKHTALFEVMFKQHPDAFVTMLQALKPEQVEKILDIVNIDFHWLHPSSDLHDTACKVLFKLKAGVMSRYANIKKVFEDLRRELKSDDVQPPIPYSKLLAYAETGKVRPEHQQIFRLYGKGYFATFPETKESAAEFKRYHKWMVPTNAKQCIIYNALMDGDLALLKEHKITQVDIYDTTVFENTSFAHKHLYDPLYEYFYQLSQKENFSPLAAAVYFNQKQHVISVLAEHKIPINQKQGDYEPILLAAMLGRDDFLELLLTNGAEIETKTVTSKTTALLFACIYKRRSTIILLLEKGANINVSTIQGKTPLYHAIHSGLIDIVNLLLEKGADINVAFDNPHNPLFIAVSNDSLVITKLLLERGAKVNNYKEPKFTPLLCAIEKGNFEIVSLLLQFDADPNLHNPLALAVQNNFPDIVLLLLQKGANINALVNEAGETVLHLAAKSDNPVIVRMLLEHGADKTIKASGKLAVECATAQEVRDLLIKRPKAAETKQVVETKQVAERKLEISEEKMDYFIKSMVATDFPDFKKLLNPSPAASEIFKEEKDLQALAKAFEQENKLEYHVSFFRNFLRKHPDRLGKMFLVMRPENVIKIFERIDMDAQLFNPESELANQAGVVRKMLRSSKSHDAKIQAWSQNMADAFAKLPEQLKLLPPPIKYSTLLDLAKKSTPDLQPVFKVYLKYYFKSNEYEKFIVEDQPDFMTAFLKAHEKRLKEIPGLKDFIIPLYDGDIQKLQKIDVYLLAHQIAATLQNAEVLKFLYQLKSESKPKGKFFWAVALKQLDALKEMKDIDVNFSCKPTTPLNTAVRISYNCCEALLARGAKHDFGFHYELPIKESVIDQENIEMLRLLIERGADVNSVLSDNGSTVLMVAIERQNIDAVRLLCRCGANVNAVNKNGRTPLSDAVTSNQIEMVKCLLEVGADISLKHDLVFSRAKTPAMQEVLLAAELENALKKAPEEKSEEYGRFFSGGCSVQETKEAVEMLLKLLKDGSFKNNFHPFRHILGILLTKEPWRGYLIRAQAIANMVEDKKPSREQKR